MTRAGYDSRAVPSWWRHRDFGEHQVVVRCLLRRLDCPTHGVRVQVVPFAWPAARFTRDFEDLTAFLVTRTGKTTIALSRHRHPGARLGVLGVAAVSAGNPA